MKEASDGEWLHDGTLECPACSSACSDCSNEGRAVKVSLQPRIGLEKGKGTLQPAQAASVRAEKSR